jgi:hypothetical protein
MEESKKQWKIRAVFLAFVVLLASIAANAAGNTFTRIDKNKKIIHGVMTSVDPDGNKITIVDDFGVTRTISYSKKTIFYSASGHVRYLHFHPGTKITVRCKREIIDDTGPEARLCPLVITADRVYMYNFLAASEVSR